MKGRGIRNSVNLVILVTLTATLVLVSSASADRNARHGEREEMLAAAGFTGGICPPESGYPEHACKYRTRISTVDRNWGAVFISGHNVQSDTVSLRRHPGAKGNPWFIHQRGNGGGCGVPRGVVRDLHLSCF